MNEHNKVILNLEVNEPSALRVGGVVVREKCDVVVVELMLNVLRCHLTY